MEDRYAILQAMQAQIIQDRKRRIAKSYQCPELEKGIDLVWGKVVHQGDRNAESPVKPSGKVLSGQARDAWCARCEKPCSYKHLMWECDWWADNPPGTE